MTKSYCWALPGPDFFHSEKHAGIISDLPTYAFRRLVKHFLYGQHNAGRKQQTEKLTAYSAR